jgi:hypothetical protein
MPTKAKKNLTGLIDEAVAETKRLSAELVILKSEVSAFSVSTAREREVELLKHRDYMISNHFWLLRKILEEVEHSFQVEIKKIVVDYPSAMTVQED